MTPCKNLQQSLEILFSKYLFNYSCIIKTLYKYFLQSIMKLPSTVTPMASQASAWLARLTDINFLKELHEQTRIMIQRQELEAKCAEINSMLEKKIQIEKQLVENEERPLRKGRGGNNIAENIKKAVLAIMRKKLPAQVNQELQERLIRPYNLKSQKENIVLFFMFLHVFARQGKISLRDIQNIQAELVLKIDKYIANSENRMDHEDWRTEFHQKNIQEFRKFRDLDLDFSFQRKFQDVEDQISTFYIRKKVDIKKATDKVRMIINACPELRQLIEATEAVQIVKEQQVSQTPLHTKEEAISAEVYQE